MRKGLAEDVRYYGKWMRDEAEKRIGHLYPKIEITAGDGQGAAGPEAVRRARSSPSSPGCGRARLRARTLPSRRWTCRWRPPSCFLPRRAKKLYVEPVIENGSYRFTVKVGKPRNAEAAKNGTKLSRGANFMCLMSGIPIAGDHIKAEGKAGRMGARLMAIVAEGERGRVYLPPTPDMEAVARTAEPKWMPEGSFVEDGRAFTPCIYGLKEWRHLFTPRQLMALTTFSDLVQEARERVKHDAIAAGLPDDGNGLAAGGSGAMAYADAVGVYLGFGVSKSTDMCNALCAWGPTDWRVRHLFARQAIPMVWDFAETSPLNDSAGAVYFGIEYLTKALTTIQSMRSWERSPI